MEFKTNDLVYVLDIVYDPLKTSGTIQKIKYFLFINANGKEAYRLYNFAIVEDSDLILLREKNEI